jgi:hypothetical protein
MKSNKRALRRHHRERMIQRTLRSCRLALWADDPELLRARVLRWYNNRKKCSCYLCGNPRKYWGCVTIQEQRQLQAARGEVKWLER